MAKNMDAKIYTVVLIGTPWVLLYLDAPGWAWFVSIGFVVAWPWINRQMKNSLDPKWDDN
jgi:hypothetical protein